MDKYEYKLKTEQMLELMENGAYNLAAEIADAIDWKRVRNATMLTNVSDIYEKNGDYQKSYEVLNIAYHRAEGSRKVLYRLCTLALKTGNVDEAIDYYDDFLQVAPKDPNQHILKYKILRARRASIEQQIEALEEFKKAEYLEEWAFELAKLYQEAGMTAECLEECDDLILWFSEGKFVYKAMELKMQYKQLTPSQQERYDRRYEKLESETVEIPDLTEYQVRNDDEDSLLSDREELDKEREREVLRHRELGGETTEEDSDEELAEDEEVPEEEAEISDETETEAEEPEEAEPEEETEVDETVKKLEEKGIGSRMKLEDALKSLLHPKTEEMDPEEEDSEEDEMEEEIPELEAAIEEIENVIDLELVNELTGKPEKEGIRFDSDLEELKAEPLEEPADDEAEIGLESDNSEELDDIPEEVLEEIEEVQGTILGETENAGEEYTESDEEISEEDIEDAGAFPVEYLEEEYIEEYSEEEEDYPEEIELPEEYSEEYEEPEVLEEIEEAEEHTEEYSEEEDYPEEEELPEEYSEEYEEPEELEEIEEAEEYTEEYSEEAEDYPEEELSEEYPEGVEEPEELEGIEDAEEYSEEIEELEEFEEIEEPEELLAGDTEAEDDIQEEAELPDEAPDEAEELVGQGPEHEEELPEEAEEIEEVSETEESDLKSEEPAGSERIEEDQTAENIKPESKKPAEEDQIDGQLSIEDILNDLKEESAEEVDMEDKKKKAEPILPPDIQRMIDEIEGVLPEEPEPEPVRPVRRRAGERRENMGAITQQLRIDDIADYLSATNDESYIDDLPEDVEENYSYDANAYEGDYAEEEYADEYEDEYPAEEYTDEYAEENADGYEAEYAEEDSDEYEEEYAEEEYADEYEEEYAEEEYADEYEDEYAEEEYADEYEEEYAEEEYTDEYEEEYPEEEYSDEAEDEYAEEEYADEYEDEYEETGYADDEYDAADGYEEDYGDIEASFEEEFRPNPKHANEPDDREIPDEDDGIDILSATTPLSRKETAKLIATGKTSPMKFQMHFLYQIQDLLFMAVMTLPRRAELGQGQDLQRSRRSCSPILFR